MEQNNKILDIYLKAKGKDKKDDVISIVPYSPMPSEKDYKAGYFNRFFVARYDAPAATEVSEKFYNESFPKLAEGLYKKAEVRWYIKEGVNIERDDEFIWGGKTAQALNIHTTNKAARQKRFPQLLRAVDDFLEFVK